MLRDSRFVPSARSAGAEEAAKERLVEVVKWSVGLLVSPFFRENRVPVGVSLHIAEYKWGRAEPVYSTATNMQRLIIQIADARFP